MDIWNSYCIEFKPVSELLEEGEIPDCSDVEAHQYDEESYVFYNRDNLADQYIDSDLVYDLQDIR